MRATQSANSNEHEDDGVPQVSNQKNTNDIEKIKLIEMEKVI